MSAVRGADVRDGVRVRRGRLSMRGSASTQGAKSFSRGSLGFQETVAPSIANNRLLAITMLARPNRLNSCAVFFAKPL